MNVEIVAFSNALKNFVNKSQLPDEVKRLVLVEVLAEQEKRALAAVTKELDARDRREAKRNAKSV